MDIKQKRILESAIKALAENPKASMTVLAKAAGVSRMTIHRHFQNREKLIEATQELLIEKADLIMEQAREFSADPKAQLKFILTEHANAGNGFHIFAQVNHSHEEHDPSTCRFAEMNRELKAVIEKLRSNGSIRSDMPAGWVFNLFNGILFTAWESFRDGATAPRDIPDLAWRSFAEGVFARE